MSANFFTRTFLLFFFAANLLSATAQIPFYGRTTGRLPSLEYGLGDDRLGGAKMGYLDSNILVKVVDTAGGDYKVQLSRAHTAYLPKTAFKFDTSIKPKPYYLTGSWRLGRFSV